MRITLDAGRYRSHSRGTIPIVTLRTGVCVIDRRAFLAVLGGFASVAPVVDAQQSAHASAHIAVLFNSSIQAQAPQVEAFRRGLRDHGWIEGQNMRIEYRSAEGKADRVQALVADLVRLKLDAIVASGTIALRALQHATSTIPVVSAVLLLDPVRLGLAASFARPGGNITGLASQYEQIITKHVELLTEAMPGISRVQLLHHATADTETAAAAVTAAETLGLKVRVVVVSEVAEFERAFKTARAEGVQAVLVGPSPIFNAHRRVLIRLAASYRLPAFYEFKDYVTDGGLISYGPSLPEMYRRAAYYVDRILKGAKPAEIPIERPSTYELVVNLKTARALGLTIPRSILLRSDHVIE